ncbi:saccharopine dehydrogenase [Actinophytocola sediminis]
MTALWLRAETRASERRTPITPADAASLVAGGTALTVEDSPRRAFPTEDYAAAGCPIVPAGSWVDAPAEVVVVGLKELPDEPAALRHRHVMFGHAYKGQPGAARLLARFARGGGTLLDLEYLTDDTGRRLAAFGYFAGYIGAAVAVLHQRGTLDPPLRPTTRAELDARIAATGDSTRAVVLGALGRCGRGAVEAFTTAGITPSRWDLAETRDLDRAALLDHEILLNAVLATEPGTPFLTPADLDEPRRLAVVCDVTCDVGSDCNLLPIYDSLTDWANPASRLRARPPLDLIAVDNLPSLLPAESSVAFSADLLPQLRELDGAPWQRCAQLYRTALGQ